MHALPSPEAILRWRASPLSAAPLLHLVWQSALPEVLALGALTSAAFLPNASTSGTADCHTRWRGAADGGGVCHQHCLTEDMTSPCMCAPLKEGSTFKGHQGAHMQGKDMSSVRQCLRRCPIRSAPKPLPAGRLPYDGRTCQTLSPLTTVTTLFQALRQQYHSHPCCRRAGLRPLQHRHPAWHRLLCGELSTLMCCLILCLHLTHNGSVSDAPPAANRWPQLVHH